MHIIYIQEQHPNDTETFVRAEIGELINRGYQTKVLTFKINEAVLPDCTYPNEIHCVEPVADPNQTFKNLLETVARFNPTYLHSHFVTEAVKYLYPVAKELNIPFGFTCHAYDIWRRGDRIEPEVIKELSIQDLCITAAVEGTRHRDYLKNCGVPSDKIIITPNSVDRRKLPTEKTNFPTGVKSIIAVGRPVAKKGFFVAIDAVRLLRLQGYAVNLEILGGADNRTPLGNDIKQYASNFPFINATSMLPNQETLKKIQDADLLITPSIIAENGDSDGIPTVMAEAMLMKVPVISTNVGSITDLVVPEKTGWIARSGDPASLAERIIAVDFLYKTPEAAKDFLNKAFQHAAKQEIQASVNTLAAHLEKRLGRFT